MGTTTQISLTTAWVQVAEANQRVVLQRLTGTIYLRYQALEPDANSTEALRALDNIPVELFNDLPLWARAAEVGVLVLVPVPTIEASGLPIAPATLAEQQTQTTALGLIAKDGTDITTPVAMPTGGVGIRGWLSAIWTKINGTLTVGGKAVQKFVAFTRPADTAAYIAHDVVANSTSSPTLMEFQNCTPANGGQGYITKVRLMTDQKTCTARFRITFYHTATTAINDNAPKTMLYANRAKLIGRIDLDACATEDATNSTAAYAMSTAVLPFVLAAGNTSIYCMQSTLDAFTPASGQAFYLEITCEQS